MRKQFDQDLFDRNDRPAREATKRWLRGQGWAVTDHPNPYALDLIAIKDDSLILAECEIKAVWEGMEFPFDTVQLPARKAKFLHPRAVFFIWNKSLDNALYFWSKDVKHLSPVLVPNKYIKNGEYFYQIPLNLVKFPDDLPVQD